jgi:hypothetical protein
MVFDDLVKSFIDGHDNSFVIMLDPNHAPNHIRDLINSKMMKLSNNTFVKS